MENFGVVVEICLLVLFVIFGCGIITVWAFNPEDIRKRALEEKKHRDRSDKATEIISNFVKDKKRFLFLAQALDGYFDFQRAIEIKEMIDEAEITLVAYADNPTIYIYHKGELINTVR